MKSLQLLALATLGLSLPSLACNHGNSCPRVSARAKRVFGDLTKINTGELGKPELLSCLKNESPLVKVSRCSEIAPGKAEDECLSNYKFTSTYGKPEEECAAPGGSLPMFEVVELNPGNFVIRQNKCSSVEAPFMYLMVGENGAFMHDTGAYDESGVGEVGAELRKLIEEILAKKAAEVGHPIDLTVGHGHSHGDHMAGDEAFKNPSLLSSGGKVTVVGASPSEVAAAYGIPNWGNGKKPDMKSVGSIDLGGRKLSVIPVPGHEAASVAFYDHSTGDVYTGDSLYPGNVFTNGNWNEHRDSVDRLETFLDNLPKGSRPVRMVLGSHVEQSQPTETGPGKDLGWGNPNQPNEHNIVLRRKHLQQMQAYLKDPKSKNKDVEYSDFSIRP